MIGVHVEKRNKPDPNKSVLDLGEKIVQVQIDEIVVGKMVYVAAQENLFLHHPLKRVISSKYL